MSAGRPVTGIGLACAAGTHPAALYASAEAGMMSLARDPELALADAGGDPLPLYTAPVLPADDGGVPARVETLAASALAALARHFPPPEPAAAVHLVLPSRDTARGEGIDEARLARALRRAAALPATVPVTCHYGEPLDRVLPAPPGDGTVLLGAADSVLDLEAAAALLDAGRLRVYRDENGLGLGEAGVFVALGPEGAPGPVRLAGWGGAGEPHAGAAGTRVLEGTVAAASAALAAAGLEAEAVEVVIHDLSLAPGDVLEWAQAAARLWPRRLDERRRLAVQAGEADPPLAPLPGGPEELGAAATGGDAGAASALRGLALAWGRLVHGLEPAAVALVVDAACAGRRVALVLEHEPPQGGEEP